MSGSRAAVLRAKRRAAMPCAAFLQAYATLNIETAGQV
jgi:hypothetical protein